MTAAGAARDRLGTWCGWVLVGAAGFVPLLTWLGPLGFALLVAVVGLLTLPAFRIDTADRLLFGVLLALVILAAVSSLYSPFRPKSPEASTALKLALQLPLYWSAICAARRADPRLARLALIVLAWGLGVVGAVLLAEAFTGGEIYRRIHVALYEPIRPDLARKNLAQSTFVLALLWPVATMAGWRAGAPAWLGALMAAGAGIAAWMFLSDAPVIGIVVAVLAGLLVYAWPRYGPRLVAIKAALLFLLAPLLVLGVRIGTDLSSLALAAPPSWAQRMGYWSAATDLIARAPLIGWGLDASRTFAPAIQLHPHDAPLQVWLELGVLGSVAAATAWALVWLRLQRPARSVAAAATAATAAVYLLFALINFGVWQEWWLALAALCGIIATLASRVPPRQSAAP